MLYNKKPPSSGDLFLEYQQENNGKLPTKLPTRIATGAELRRNTLTPSTTYGQFWHQDPSISQKRREAAEAKARETQDARRHGDSPKAT